MLRKHPARTLLLSTRNPKSLWAADLPRPESRRAFVFMTSVRVCNAQPRRTEKSFKFHTLQKRMCFLAPIVQVTTARTNQLVHGAEGTEDTHQGHSPPQPGDTVSGGQPGLQGRGLSFQNALDDRGMPRKHLVSVHPPSRKCSCAPEPWREKRKGGGHLRSRNSLLGV